MPWTGECGVSCRCGISFFAHLNPTDAKGCATICNRQTASRRRAFVFKGVPSPSKGERWNTRLFKEPKWLKG